MQELEKILEEINKRIDRSMLYSYQHAEGLREAKGIILKRMNDAEYPYIVKKTAEKYRKKNDGWIPVGNPPKTDYETVLAVDKKDYYFVAVYTKEHGFRTNDIGADIDNIVAYCLFEPYRPERSEGE